MIWNIYTRFDQIEASLFRIEAKMGQFDDDLTGLTNAVTTLTGDVTSALQQLQQQIQQGAPTQAQLQTLETAISGLQQLDQTVKGASAPPAGGTPSASHAKSQAHHQ